MTPSIAIVSVAYNRSASLRRQLESLDKAVYRSPATLIISIDKSKTDEVQRCAERFLWRHGDKRVIAHKHNLGLRAHILSLGDYLNEFDAIIVLEDDVTVAPAFMDYAMACVDKYANDDRIAGISLYNFKVNHLTQRPFEPAKSAYDIYFMNVAMSWGQVWMKRQWKAFHEWYLHHDEEFNLPHIPDNVNQWGASSWLKYHMRYCIEQDKYFVFPYFSLSTNHADAGVHMREQDNIFQTAMLPFPQAGFNLPTLDECHVRYDGFFEPKYLAPYLGLDEGQLCVDLLGNKPQGLWQRYLLATKALPYRTVHTYGLCVSPIEANVVLGTGGNDIFLYDTSQEAPPPRHPDPYRIYFHLYRKAFYDAIFIMGPVRICSLLWDLLLYKCNRVFHTRFKTHIS